MANLAGSWWIPGTEMRASTVRISLLRGAGRGAAAWLMLRGRPCRGPFAGWPGARAQHDRRRRRAVDGRTTRHAGYWQSQKRRTIVEQVFGWMKTVGGGRKLRFVGRERNRCRLELTAAAYNLVRMARHETAAA